MVSRIIKKALGFSLKVTRCFALSENLIKPCKNKVSERPLGCHVGPPSQAAPSKWCHRNDAIRHRNDAIEMMPSKSFANDGIEMMHRNDGIEMMPSKWFIEMMANDGIRMICPIRSLTYYSLWSSVNPYKSLSKSYFLSGPGAAMSGHPPRLRHSKWCHRNDAISHRNDGIEMMPSKWCIEMMASKWWHRNDESEGIEMMPSKWCHRNQGGTLDSFEKCASAKTSKKH